MSVWTLDELDVVIVGFLSPQRGWSIPCSCTRLTPQTPSSQGSKRKVSCWGWESPQGKPEMVGPCVTQRWKQTGEDQWMFMFPWMERQTAGRWILLKLTLALASFSYRSRATEDLEVVLATAGSCQRSNHSSRSLENLANAFDPGASLEPKGESWWSQGLSTDCHVWKRAVSGEPERPTACPWFLGCWSRAATPHQLFLSPSPWRLLISGLPRFSPPPYPKSLILSFSDLLHPSLSLFYGFY